MRKQISWWMRGADHTTEALDGHAAAIRELQRQVAELSAVVDRIEPIVVTLDRDWRALPGELRSVVDDLGDRIGALDRRLDEAGS